MQMGKKNMLLLAAVGAAVACGGYLWLNMSKEIKLDNAFVIGRVIKLTSPVAGKVEAPERLSAA